MLYRSNLTPTNEGAAVTQRLRFQKFRRLRFTDIRPFAEIGVGEKFATHQYLWEKVDHRHALVVDVIENGSCTMLGRRRPFYGWTPVETVQT